jgi:hypothetical protein
MHTDQLTTRSEPAAGALTVRAFSISTGPGTYDPKTRSVQAVLATDAPVQVLDMARWEIIDETLRMDGAILPPSGQVPLLDAHNRFSIEAQLGSTRELRIEAGRLVGRRFFADTPAARDAESKVRDGHLSDGSIGYQVTRAEMIPAGESHLIDGRTFTAGPDRPLRVALEWAVKEDSLVPIGADPAAKVRAASFQAQGASHMPQEATTQVRTAPGPSISAPAAQTVPAAPSPADLDARRELDIRELAEFGSVAPDVLRAALDAKETLEQARQRFVAARNVDTGGHVAHAPAPMIWDTVDRAVTAMAPAIGDSILMRAGVALLEEGPTGAPLLDPYGKPKVRAPHPEAARYATAGRTIADTARAFLQGLGVPTDGFSRREILKRALSIRGDGISTISLPNVLADTMGRSLRAAYAELSPQWPKFARHRTHPDFRTITRVDLGALEDLEEVAPAGEYSHVFLSGDQGIQYRLRKFGKLVGYTWEDMLNDRADQSVFSRIPQNLAAAGVRQEDMLVIAVLVANGNAQDGKAFMGTDHGNLAASGCVPSVEAFNAGRLAMRLAKPLAAANVTMSGYLNVEPACWVGPAALEGTVDELLATPIRPAEAGATVATNVGNIWRGRLAKAVHPLLDKADDAQWYMTGPAGMGFIELCMLGESRYPTVESEQAFEVDAIRFKVRHVLAAALIDHRGLYCNPGD